MRIPGHGGGVGQQDPQNMNVRAHRHRVTSPFYENYNVVGGSFPEVQAIPGTRD